ncbi:hypothetical protein LTR56_013686 [Elasticomyces elasticus]|nr:hypothetical protein LTR56_013686 [Elasticomyces elasticus]KAK3668490.1 hypothetical protein LTR22_000784 [Elasticomyces elasticus]KAK4930820.1 hypothetical protein LTR49_002584 [Elasticomyces elasticus]KAK5748232.1 hypothetical protein LTS12_021695 [Elasticomyces elasticus]
MGHGSPVFKALFNPDRFHEGITLATESKVEVPFPEDDPYYMSILCSILHMRHDMVPKFTTTTMKEFVKLCDKYDCGLAVKPFLDQDIMAILPNATETMLKEYLEIVVLLHYADFVERIAMLLVYHSTQPLISRLHGRDSLELDALLAMIEITRLRARREIVIQIDSVIDDLSTQGWACLEMDRSCKSTIERTFSLMEQLKEDKLRSETEGCSLDDMLRSMESVRLYDPFGLRDCINGCEDAKGLSQYDMDFYRKANQIRMLVKGTSFSMV